MPDNPFEVLRLDPTTDAAEVVRQGARLCQRTADEAARNAIRQAVRQLTGSDGERRLHALLTHPRPDLGSACLDRFQAAHRRPPQAGTPTPPPALDIEELRDLLLAQLASELAPPALPLELPAGDDSPDEIARQTGEALWQGLPAQPRA
jgi:hypothetical protein